MQKFLLSFLLLAAISYTNDEKLRSDFLFSYHNGDYEKAHSLLAAAIQDPVSRQIWEERMHLQCETLPACARTPADSRAIQGTALLRIGKLKEARASFADDWLSLLGLANLSWWENDRAAARKYVHQALTLAPENPEVLYFAADYAPNTELSIDLFSKFLELPTEDPSRKRIAEYSIEFMKKTSGMQLNISSIPADVESVDSQFRDGRLLIQIRINEKEKAALLLDTGSGGVTLINEEWQPRVKTDMLLFGLGKTQSTRGSRIVLDRLDAGNFSVKNAVASISYTFDGDGVQGIAGTAMFSDYLILVPMKPGKDVTLFLPCEEEPLSCIEKKGFRFSNHTTLPFQMVNHLIVIKGRIKKSEEDMDILVDTGAANSLISASAAKIWTHINYVLSRQMNSDVVGLAGKAEKTLLAENVELQMGALSKTYNRIAAVNLAETNEAMQLELDFILGRDFLNGFSLLIDYRNNQITFLK